MNKKCEEINAICTNAAQCYHNDADDYYCDENDFQTFRKNICLPFYFSFNECS